MRKVKQRHGRGADGDNEVDKAADSVASSPSCTVRYFCVQSHGDGERDDEPTSCLCVGRIVMFTFNFVGTHCVTFNSRGD